MVGVVGANMHDLTGQKFGRLLCLSWESRQMTSRREIFWEVKCDCGTVKWVKSQLLKRGKTVSCGCWNKEKSTLPKKHGMCDTPEYSTYNQILKRCYTETFRQYHDYGGRGIKVCERWLEPKGRGFLNFLEDMGKRPSKEFSIDRIDVNGNYEPTNCKWEVRNVQSFNRRAVKDSSTEVIGVTKHPKSGKFHARLQYKGKEIWLGSYFTLGAAREAVIKAEIKYYGFNRDRSKENE